MSSDAKSTLSDLDLELVSGGMNTVLTSGAGSVFKPTASTGGDSNVSSTSTGNDDLSKVVGKPKDPMGFPGH